MKNKNLLVTVAILIIAMSSLAQVTGTFTDARDGKVYKTVTIGTQTWMAENLAYKADSECWAYGNKTTNVIKYGFLYNWETAKKAVPKGWHLPSKEEWLTLRNYLGGESSAGEKMKSKYEWDLGLMENNESGFSCLPGGCRVADGKFLDMRFIGYWWSSTEYNTSNAWCLYLFDSSRNALLSDTNKQAGLSVRLIKD